MYVNTITSILLNFVIPGEQASYFCFRFENIGIIFIATALYYYRFKVRSVNVGLLFKMKKKKDSQFSRKSLISTKCSRFRRLWVNVFVHAHVKDRASICHLWGVPALPFHRMQTLPVSIGIVCEALSLMCSIFCLRWLPVSLPWTQNLFLPSSAQQWWIVPAS